jgi:HlyD family secretion protein
MKNRILIIGGIVLAFTALFAFNKLTTKSKNVILYAEARKDVFEITVSASGELIAEKSIDIKGPEIGQTQQQGGGGRGQNVMVRGGDMHAMDLKIQDIIPEGTIVKAGDYIAQLDRTSYSNSLKDANENLVTEQNTLEMKVLDTTVTLTTYRDDIKNQRYVVEEAEITLAQSKYEPPATVRQAEIALDKAKRALEQKKKGYQLRVAQTLAEINHQKQHVTRATRLVSDLEDFLSKFTITAPADGMIIYKKDRNGTKRKAGSNVNPFDRVIATLPDLSSLISKIYVNEIEVSKVKPGQKVVISVDAFPDKSFTGTVSTIANIGEVLPNSDAKMFEVLIKLNGDDPLLRPSMTTSNKITIKTFNDAIFIPTECVQTGADSIPFIYEKNKTKQIVVLGDANEKFVIIKKGLKPGTAVYVNAPEEPENFRLRGEELIPEIKKEL